MPEKIASGRARWRRGTGRLAAGAAAVLIVRFHIRRVDLRIFGDAAGERGELHRLQERDQFARIRFVHREFIDVSRVGEADDVADGNVVARQSKERDVMVIVGSGIASGVNNARISADLCESAFFAPPK